MGGNIWSWESWKTNGGGKEYKESHEEGENVSLGGEGTKGGKRTVNKGRSRKLEEGGKGQKENGKEIGREMVKQGMKVVMKRAN